MKWSGKKEGEGFCVRCSRFGNIQHEFTRSLPDARNLGRMRMATGEALGYTIHPARFKDGRVTDIQQESVYGEGLM